MNVLGGMYAGELIDSNRSEHGLTHTHSHTHRNAEMNNLHFKLIVPSKTVLSLAANCHITSYEHFTFQMNMHVSNFKKNDQK